MFRCSIRTVLGTALVLGGCARLVAASPQLLFDQTAGDSWVDWDVMTVPGTHYLSVTGPRVGIVRYEPATGWTLLDTPELDEYRTAPFWAAGHVFFSGSPSGGDNRKHLYVVDGDGAVELAVAPESLWSVGLIIEIGGRAVFEFADDTHGTELWASDGSPGGTRLLKDINPTGDSFPDLGVVAGGFLFFSADDGIHGRELWLTDGSSAGTRMVKDILPGPEGSFPYDLEEVNGLVVFRALDELAGLEPHRSDGTEAGTYLVRDLEPGEGWSRPEGFTTIDGWAYFLARTDDLGLEPYRTNGNAVQFIRDINPGYRSCAWFSRGFFGYNGEVYFAADDGVHGDEPWKTDGTSPGTQMVDDCTPGLDDTSPATFVEAGGTLFFRASPASSTGSELWKTLGTTGTTQEVAVNPNGPCFPNLLFGTSSYLYFGATDGTSVGHEPRRLDVATGTIELLEDLNTDDGSNCERLTAYGEDLLAFSDSWQFGRDLWHFDLADPEASFDFDDGGWHESQAPAGARFAVDGALVYFTGWHQDTGFEVG
ncbi:MAG: hypothetical protein KC729_07985, partial [Candidatus Eisenbacteria bacterium]|nr:hypothetical protein [Candidatus Eisenbacteria bacterium]